MTIEHQRLSSFGYSSLDNSRHEARTAGQGGVRLGRAGQGTTGQGTAGRAFSNIRLQKSLNIKILILENHIYKMFSSSKNC